MRDLRLGIGFERGFGLGFGPSRRASGSAPEPSSYEGLIATHCRPSNATNASFQEIMSRTSHDAADDISSLKIAIANFRLLPTSANEVPIGGSGDLTVTASVEYPANTFTQITFAASASAVIADGDIVFSDYTAGDLGIPSGATFWIRIHRSCAAGIIYNNWRNSARGDVSAFGTSGTIADQTMSGTIVSSGNATAGPLMIIGTMHNPSVCVIGDSKTWGQGDTSESVTAAGPGLRGEITKSFPASLPFLNIATGSLRADTWSTNCVARPDVFPYFSHYVVNLGHNDFYLASRTGDQVKADIETIVASIVAANPSAQITLATQSHRSTSAGGQWVSTADQTANINNPLRVTYNGYVRAGSVVGNNNGFFELSDQLETARDSSIWKNDGVTNKLYTSDGTHETPAGYDLIVTAGAVDHATKFVYP